MTINVLHGKDINKWHHYFEMLPEKIHDVFASPEYMFHSQDQGYGQAVCLVMEEEESLYYLPFLKVPIDAPDFKEFSNYCDIKGAYGYNGILAANPTPERTVNFNHFFQEYAKEVGAITAFLRCNPIYENHVYFDPACIYYQLQNILLDLTDDDIFNHSYEHSTRKNIHKAEREGLTVNVVRADDLNDQILHDFMQIYNSTMARNQADNFYFFSYSYFKSLLHVLKDNALVFFAYKDGARISAELVLLNKFTGYSFLGGTLREFYPYRPNDLLKHHIIKFLKDFGCNIFCLGGGPEGVVRYKKTFAKNGERDFMVFRKVFNEKIYSAINQKWESLFPDKIEKYGLHFQKYRF